MTEFKTDIHTKKTYELTFTTDSEVQYDTMVELARCFVDHRNVVIGYDNNVVIDKKTLERLQNVRKNALAGMHSVMEYISNLDDNSKYLTDIQLIIGEIINEI